MSQEVFAFGDNWFDNCPCPVSASNAYSIGGMALQVAEMYDEIVRERYGIDEGTIPESVAKSCWNEAVERLDSQAVRYEGDDDEHSNYLYECAQTGDDIGAELFE